MTTAQLDYDLYALARELDGQPLLSPKWRTVAAKVAATIDDDVTGEDRAATIVTVMVLVAQFGREALSQAAAAERLMPGYTDGPALLVERRNDYAGRCSVCDVATDTTRWVCTAPGSTSGGDYYPACGNCYGDLRRVVDAQGCAPADVLDDLRRRVLDRRACPEMYRRRQATEQRYFGGRAPVGEPTATAVQLQGRFAYYGGRCYMCGVDLTGRPYHWEHVKPVSAGGPNLAANLRPACPSCNSRKGGTWPRRVTGGATR